MEGYHKLELKEVSEETRLELRLGLPGDDDDEKYSMDACHGAKRGFQYTTSIEEGKLVEKKVCPSERVAQPPTLVGWPPVRTSRKNSTKVVSLSQKVSKDGKKSSSYPEQSLFVKINMDGVPIGRKVDLRAYDNYQTLSSAVDQLFRGLLAAQGDAYGGLIMKQTDAIVGLLDGNGEYTLVYEDNEGDRILVGDVPWDMFISSAKRLRVLKRSELSIFHHKSK